MSQVKFIHAADLHLGAPLKGIPWSEALDSATYESFHSSILEANKRKVDFYILSGDVFDRPTIEYDDWKFFTSEAAKLTCPMYVIAGNHDDIASWNKTKSFGKLPENVKLFQDTVEHVEFKDIEIIGKSFNDLKDPIGHNLEGFENNENKLAIGILHTTMENAKFESKNIKYWALGHIHKRQTHEFRNCTVAYPGAIQGLHINAKTQAGGVNYVELSDSKCNIEFVPTAKIIWKRISIDVSECNTFDDIIELANKTVFDNLCTRITLTGKTKLHKEFTANNLKYLQEQITNDNVYCQKVIDQTEPLINEEALLENNQFPARVLKAKIEKLNPSNKFNIPYDYKVDMEEILKKARMQALDMLEINE